MSNAYLFPPVTGFKPTDVIRVDALATGADYTTLEAAVAVATPDEVIVLTGDVDTLPTITITRDVKIYIPYSTTVITPNVVIDNCEVYIYGEGSLGTVSVTNNGALLINLVTLTSLNVGVSCRLVSTQGFTCKGSTSIGANSVIKLNNAVFNSFVLNSTIDTSSTLYSCTITNILSSPSDQILVMNHCSINAVSKVSPRANNYSNTLSNETWPAIP